VSVVCDGDDGGERCGDDDYAVLCAAEVKIGRNDTMKKSGD
jgi:hypothetical protein